MVQRTWVADITLPPAGRTTQHPRGGSITPSHASRSTIGAPALTLMPRLPPGPGSSQAVGMSWVLGRSGRKRQRCMRVATIRDTDICGLVVRAGPSMELAKWWQVNGGMHSAHAGVTCQPAKRSFSCCNAHVAPRLPP